MVGVAVVVVLVYGTMLPGLVQAETTIIPEATLRGRYDSNIFNRPAQLLPAGTKTADYVTVVGGDVRVLHETRDITADLKAGATFNAYVEHQNRNFATALLSGTINLDRWVEQYVKGASLQISEFLRYTPEPPGFLTGDPRQPLGNDAFFRGVHGFRSPALINSTDFTSSYQVSRDLSFEGGYSFGIRRQGKIQGGDIGGVTYFNTITHTWFGGPRYKLTRNDSVAAVYRQTFLLQSRPEGSRSFSTNLVTLAVDYTKTFQEWSFTAEGGITFVEPAGRSFPSGSLHVRTSPERDTAVTLSLSRAGRPSYFLQGGATISNLAQLGISHRVYERLEVSGGVGYAYNEFLPNSTGAFKMFTGTSKISYKLTRNITGDLIYVFSNIDNDATAVQYQFSRHQVGFALTAAWN
jgi:hypothetical protein